MTYLLEFIKGILLALGIIAGFALFIAYLFYKGSSDDEGEDAESLVKPFTKYLHNCQEDERYEELGEVQAILESLRKGEMPESVQGYKMKKDNAIMIGDEDGKTLLRIKKNWIIIGKKAQEAP